MTRGIVLANCPTNSEFSVCVIGLGGGCLPSFLNRKFLEIRIVCIELDPVVVEIANSWFAFTPNWRMESLVDDGVRYIDQAFKERTRFNVMILDVSSDIHKEGLVAPIPELITDDCLNKIKTIVGPKGLLVMNLVTRDETKAEDVKQLLRAHFSCVGGIKIEEQVNEVLFCFPLMSKTEVVSCRQTFLDELSSLEVLCFIIITLIVKCSHC
ncbi:unnamed protein product [Soboliphyme baturini]|uniref:PABS domain-containing protein n=1 Tax=Soboliphyme baturini TaxID=241478 RepID=A0A183IW19_9BILA|nr:unnamed protein product [Soboliphyme baturini]